MSTTAITGIGMSTAVGPDARTSAAAFRAGINRARELVHFTALDDEQTDVGPITGHVAVPIGIHAEGLGKMVALGAGALRSLLESSGPRDHRRTGFYLALPNYSLREESFVDVDRLARAGIRHVADSGDEEDAPRSLTFALQCREHLTERLARAARVEFAPGTLEIYFGDNCAFLRAVDEAMTALTSGAVDRCIVGGIDSYLEAPSLEWGMLRRRVKCDSNPIGFVPGEAAVFLELTARETRGSTVIGHVSKPVFAEEPAQVPGSREEPPRGIGLADAIRGAMGNDGRSVGVVIADLNGEPHRANDWGHALVRSVSEHPNLREVPVWTPAESFGETGCASPGLAVGVAVEAFRRRYARTDSMLILSSSDSGDRGAAIVSGSTRPG